METKLTWETASWVVSALNINCSITHENIDYFHGELNLLNCICLLNCKSVLF